MPEFRSALILGTLPDGKFKLQIPFVYFSDIAKREIIVPQGFITDFASIPGLFQSFIQVNGKHQRAAVVHDWLCIYGEIENISQKKTDKIFLEAMKVCDVRWTQRRVMYRAVRIYQSITGFFK